MSAMIDGPEGQGSAVAMNSTAIVSREINFETLMGQTEFRVDPDRAHITVDSEICRGCSVRGCLIACPAQLFVPTSDGGILFNYEQCFECGSCYIVCNEEGAISWTYPEGGHGVVFHRS